TVRFIDNFSAGTRGATSAEYFLEAGYAVIFLHRQYSLLPYARHYSHSTNCFLDFMREGDEGKVVVDEQYQEEMREVLRKYRAAKQGNLLLLLPFTTVTDYLWNLREVATTMRPLGSAAMFYLAAAVSDFFVPRERMAEHKIQSGEIGPQQSDGSGTSTSCPPEGKKLVIDLDPVPKFLKKLVDTWAPEGMIVSFKLETDPSLLITKAQKALHRYSHHLVIGNLLSTRKWEVVLIAPGMKEKWIRVPMHRRVKSFSESSVAVNGFKSNGFTENDDAGSTVDGPLEIESIIVPEVAGMHTRHIKSAIAEGRNSSDGQQWLGQYVQKSEAKGICAGFPELLSESLSRHLQDDYVAFGTKASKMPSARSSSTGESLESSSVDIITDTLTATHLGNEGEGEQDEQPSQARKILRPKGNAQALEYSDHMSFLSGARSNKTDAAGSAFLDQELITTPLFSGAVLSNSSSSLQTNKAITFPQYGLLAERYPDYQSRSTDLILDMDEHDGNSVTPAGSIDPRLFLNVNTPWSAFICGSQGSGKSHTLSCMLENCLIPSKLGKLPNPLAAIVFHYDRFTSYSSSQVCEAAYLCSSGIPVRVLVSPTNFWRMKENYLNLPGLPPSARKPEVIPLLFQEKHLDVERMMNLMAVHEKAGPVPLYIEVILRLLRQMAMETQGAPGLNYTAFRRRLALENFTKDQNGPLKLRLDLLESFMEQPRKPGSEFDPAAKPFFADTKNGRKAAREWEAQEAERIRTEDEKKSKVWLFQPGSLTIVDLSCPFVDDSAACALFNICLALFLENRGDVGRVVALDEAHKFMTENDSASTFTQNLLQVIRQQRHLATRIIIATQEPTISPRLLDLCTITIVHRFTSPVWMKALQTHLAGASDIEDETKRNIMEIFKTVVNLEAGEALLFSPAAMLDLVNGNVRERVAGKMATKLGMHYIKMRVRKRLTADGGKSILAI
ncbi:MAG: hypothetical protein Q9187_003204, partial [Circinaria calcarea]